MTQPQSIEGEMAVLGSMLTSKAAVDKVVTILSPKHFYKDAHAKIFFTMLGLLHNSEPIDTISVVDKLKKNKELESVGGAYYITGLVESVPTTANVKSYAKIVKAKAKLRQLILIGHELQENAYRDDVDPEILLNNAETAIFNLSSLGDNTDFIHVHDLIERSIDRLEKLSNSNNHILGVSSGFADIDKFTLGFQPSDVIVLAARPSMGKTSLAMNIVANAGKKGVSVGVFSIEMSNERLADRLLFSESGVNSYHASGGYIKKESWSDINKSAGVIAELPIYINNTINPDVITMRAQARRLKQKHKINMIVIDYIQQMYITGTNYTGNQEMTIISRHIKAMAKELNVPVIAISQLSRAVERRENKMPMLSDLRESGSIEQDADVVIFLYQPQKYWSDNMNEEAKDKERNMALCSIAKHRNGRTGNFKLTWDESTTTFKNYSEI